jgi:hypothetical protein
MYNYIILITTYFYLWNRKLSPIIIRVNGMDLACDWNTHLANQLIYESVITKYLPVLIFISYESYGNE